MPAIRMTSRTPDLLHHNQVFVATWPCATLSIYRPMSCGLARSHYTWQYVWNWDLSLSGRMLFNCSTLRSSFLHGKKKAVKGKDWYSPFICCTHDVLVLKKKCTNSGDPSEHSERAHKEKPSDINSPIKIVVTIGVLHHAIELNVRNMIDVKGTINIC